MAHTNSYTENVRVAVMSAIEAAGTNPSAVAEGTGIAQSTMSRRINGSPFTLSELESIADHLHIPVGQLSDPPRRTA